MFFSLFWLVCFVSESFQAVYTKSMHSGQICESHKTSVVYYPKHALMPCSIAVQYVVRVLYFSATSLIYVQQKVKNFLKIFNL